MKNKEFYREKIKTCDEDFCVNFIQRHVLPRYDMLCGDGLTCSQCRMLSSMWLEEEYKEVETRKIIEELKNCSIDTPIYVKEHEDDEWTIRYLKKVDPQSDRPFECFNDGRTSITTAGTTHWKYGKKFEQGTPNTKKDKQSKKDKCHNDFMRFNAGEKVIVQDWEYLHDHRLGSTEHELFKGGDITGDILILYCGDTVTIANVIGDRYTIVEDNEEYLWMDDMFV